MSKYLTQYFDGEDIYDIKDVEAHERIDEVEERTKATVGDTDDPEYVAKMIDANDNVLEGTTDDEKRFFTDLNLNRQNIRNANIVEAENVRVPFTEMFDTLGDEQEFIHTITDANGRIFEGLAEDKKKMFVDLDMVGRNLQTVGNLETESVRIAQAEEFVEEDEEHIAKIVDSEDRLLEAHTGDEKMFYTDIDMKNNNLRNVGYVEVGGGWVKDDSDENYIYKMEDADGKIMKALTEDEEIVYNDTRFVGKVTINHLDPQPEFLSDLVAALKEAGVGALSPTDWSEAESVNIPEPRCAIVNITGISKWPESKTVDLRAAMEFWDCEGNYFKKKILMAAQGNSSMVYPKKNAKMDLLNGDWDDDEAFALKIGDWVESDSFHLKAFYTDFFRGVAMVGYHLSDKILDTRPFHCNRPWKRALIDYGDVADHGMFYGGIEDLELALDDGARNYPDGFPCKVFLNGDFYGLYVFQLKKARNNMRVDKKDKKHIWLDGEIGPNTILGGTLDWDGAWEIRNPKTLYLMNGTEYDGDFNYGELMDETSPYYDLSGDSEKVKKAKQETAYVKHAIETLGTYMPELVTLKNSYEANHSAARLAALKSKFEEHFDVDTLIDYQILMDTLKDGDGFEKNWQWVTYDGGEKWYICPYDLDCVFGNQFQGTHTTPPGTSHLGNHELKPSYYIIRYYTTELNARYKELRDAGIITAEGLVRDVAAWVKRFGLDAYKAEYKKWKECSVFNNPVVDEHWQVVEDVAPVYSGNYTYSSTRNYQAGDRCTYGVDVNADVPGTGLAYMGFYTFEAVSATSGNPPVRNVLGDRNWRYHDSIYRLSKWTYAQIQNMDLAYSYTE